MNNNTEVITVRPKHLTVEVGDLVLRCPGTLGTGAELLIDGKPVAARSVTVTVAADECLTATIDYFPGLGFWTPGEVDKADEKTSIQ